MHFLCHVSSFFETSHISADDHFAALQIDLCVRGWIERFWRNRRLHHSHQFPNYVCSIKRRHTLPINERRTLSLPKKQGGAEAFPPRHIINFVTKHRSFNGRHGHTFLFLAFDELVHRRNHVLFTLNMKKFK